MLARWAVRSEGPVELAQIDAGVMVERLGELMQKGGRPAAGLLELGVPGEDGLNGGQGLRQGRGGGGDGASTCFFGLDCAAQDVDLCVDLAGVEQGVGAHDEAGGGEQRGTESGDRTESVDGKVATRGGRGERAQEIAQLLRGLAGRFVPPGPSGAPSRGRPDVLPTGRNFYSVDVRHLPTPTAWRIGV